MLTNKNSIKRQEYENILDNHDGKIFDYMDCSYIYKIENEKFICYSREIDEKGLERYYKTLIEIENE